MNEKLLVLIHLILYRALHYFAFFLKFLNHFVAQKHFGGPRRGCFPLQCKWKNHRQTYFNQVALSCSTVSEMVAIVLVFVYVELIDSKPQATLLKPELQQSFRFSGLLHIGHSSLITRISCISIYKLC